MPRFPALCFALILACSIVATPTLASHPRPSGASPFQASLVPAYDACGTPNRTHGPPLAFGSCNPPSKTSSNVTVGTPDANGAPADMIGSVRLEVIVGNPGEPDDSDVAIEVSITDVRCEAGTTACGSANADGGADYTGELEAMWQLRVTDHFNAIAPGGGTDPATLVDVTGYFIESELPCVSTADESIGASCAVVTTATAKVPGAAKDGKRMIEEFIPLQIWDGGPDGAFATSPNELFAVQGIFVP